MSLHRETVGLFPGALAESGIVAIQCERPRYGLRQPWPIGG